jgi:hypothetical protein
MLILTDSNELGDKRLSPEEGVAKLREGNRKLDEKHKIANQKLLTNVEASVGRTMMSNDFIQKLQKLNPSLIIGDGLPGAIAVRYPKIDEETNTLKPSYVTGFYKGPMSEWSLIIEDKNGKPTRHLRGWRTVLLDLLRGNIITYKQARAAFGDPHGQRNILWQEQTQTLRA